MRKVCVAAMIVLGLLIIRPANHEPRRRVRSWSTDQPERRADPLSNRRAKNDAGMAASRSRQLRHYQGLLIRRLPKKGGTLTVRLYFAVLLSQLRNRYLDSQIRLKIPLSRYLTRSTKAKAPQTMFAAGSIQSDMRVLWADSSSGSKKDGPGFPARQTSPCRAEPRFLEHRLAPLSVSNCRN